MTSGVWDIGQTIAGSEVKVGAFGWGHFKNAEETSQRLSKTVPANNQILQAVWQGISDRQASHTESPSAIKAESVVRYDQELSGGRPEMLLWCDTSDWLPQFHEVRRHLTVQAVQHHARCGLGRFNFCYSLNNNEVILKQMQ